MEEGEALLKKLYGDFDGKSDGPNARFLKQQDLSTIEDPEEADAIEHMVEYQYDFSSWEMGSLPEEDYQRLITTLELVQKQRGGPLNSYATDTSNLMRIIITGRDDQPEVGIRIDITLWSMLHE